MCYVKAGRELSLGKSKLQQNFPVLELSAGSGFTVQPSRLKVFNLILIQNPEP
jgi:hypothetical protein